MDPQGESAPSALNVPSRVTGLKFSGASAAPPTQATRSARTQAEPDGGFHFTSTCSPVKFSVALNGVAESETNVAVNDMLLAVPQWFVRASVTTRASRNGRLV